MLISHEAPKNIMNLVQEHTDYDYCLVHLMQESNEYRNFFFDAKKKKRKIILDCSLYELGHAYDINKYIAWINILDPSEYIVPDVFQSFEANIQSFEKFMSIHNPFKVTGKTIGVVQGRTYKEMKESYEFMKENADKVAISFGYDFYLKETNEEYKPLAFCKGRIMLINRLIEDGIIDYNKPHHLLGCGLPVEFSYYQQNKLKYSFIESIDTSHPVLNGYFGELYHEDKLGTKRPEKMVDIFEENVSEVQISNIISNIKYFRNNIVMKVD